MKMAHVGLTDDAFACSPMGNQFVPIRWSNHDEHHQISKFWLRRLDLNQRRPSWASLRYERSEITTPLPRINLPSTLRVMVKYKCSRATSAPTALHERFGWDSNPLAPQPEDIVLIYIADPQTNSKLFTTHTTKCSRRPTTAFYLTGVPASAFAI